MKKKDSNSVNILIVEDDDDDYFLIKEAMGEAHLTNPVKRARDGEELIAFLNEDKTKHKHAFHPGLIILDLNLPRKSGREALAEIKSNNAFRRIPVIVLTTSNAKEDISETYLLGVNSFIQKPIRFEQMVEFFSVMSKYWFHFVELPARE